MRDDIAILYFPWRSLSVYKFIDEVLLILERVGSEKIYVIGGNSDRLAPRRNTHHLDVGFGMHYQKEIKPIPYSILIWVLKVIAFQIISSGYIFKHRAELRVVLFYLAYPYHLLPVLVSKASRISTVEVVTRGINEPSKCDIGTVLDTIFFSLIDYVSPESDSLLPDALRKKYPKKILPPGYRYVDLEKFRIMKEISERDDTIGFIGRLVEEKGIKVFVKSIPSIVTKKKSVSFIVGGTGPLLEWVSEECQALSEKYGVQIDVLGYIPDECFPGVLNDIKLLVFPSTHDEGLPTILLESLACGTPVLATRVGAVSDIIKDGETGFFISSDNQEELANQIISACETSSSNDIAKNGRRLVEQKYSIDSALDRWGKITKGVADSTQ